MTDRTIKRVGLHKQDASTNTDKVYDIHLIETTTMEGLSTYMVTVSYGRRGSKLNEHVIGGGFTFDRGTGEFMNKYREKIGEGYKLVSGSVEDVEDDWDGAIKDAKGRGKKVAAEPEVVDDSVKWPKLPSKPEAEVINRVYQILPSVKGYRPAFFSFEVSFGNVVKTTPLLGSIVSAPAVGAHMNSQMKLMPDGVYDAFFGDDESMIVLDAAEIGGTNYEDADFATRWDALTSACERSNISFVLADTAFDVDREELVAEHTPVVDDTMRVLCRPKGGRKELSGALFYMELTSPAVEAPAEALPA